MLYRRLGGAGLKVSQLSLGSWLTFGNQLDVEGARKVMHTAFDAGVNFFDNAEAYASGESERIMGQVLKDFPRESFVVSTKIFWGGPGPNDKGLSRKHILEGTNKALKRLQVDYVDLLFCHRPDPETPIEETVRAMDHLIQQGKALYWGTSEWSAVEIEEAFAIARDLRLTPPSMEQPQYHLFHRSRVEEEYAPLYEKYGLGTTIWSPLASGLLTGKYNQSYHQSGGVDVQGEGRLARVKWLQGVLTPDRLKATQAFADVAAMLGVKPAQLAIAWCLKNPHVSTVILGASSVAQLRENLGAEAVVDKLTADVMAQLRQISELAPEMGD